MATEYDASVVRQLLSAAYSGEELNTLVFDLFRELYGDLNPVRSQKVIQIVEHALRKGQMEALLSYTRRHNRYQYELFAGRLVVQGKGEAAELDNQPAEPPAPLPSKERLKREQARLQVQYDLLAEKAKRLGAALVIETDVTRKFQIEQQLEEAEGELKVVGGRLDEIDGMLG